MGRVTMIPGYAGGHLGTAWAEMTLSAFSIQIMAIGTTQGAVAVESSLVFIEPRPSGRVDVAVMTACGSIAERAVEVMAFQTHRVLLGENSIAMWKSAVLPAASPRNPGAARAEVALAAFGIQIMTGATCKSTRTVESSLVFIQPLLAFGMDMAVVAVFRSGPIRTSKLVALNTDSVGSGQAEFFMGNGAVLPIDSIRGFAA